MHGLYAIVDVDSLNARSIPVLDFARSLLRTRPALLQLRAKRLAPRETLALLTALRGPCRGAGVPLFANDRADLALLAGTDGVHVGQQDLEASDVRRIGPGLRVGVSTHDRAELERALQLGLDYVAFGPVFATRSKQNPDRSVGLDGLRAAVTAAHAAGVPLVAIGGIDLGSASAIVECGADMAAVISALVPDSGDLEEATERARALHRALGGSREPS